MRTSVLIANALYSSLALFICYLSSHSGLPLSKDELYYLSVVNDNSFTDLFTLGKVDTLNFIWPLIINICGQENFNAYYRYLGPLLYIFSLWQYVGDCQVRRLFGFFFSLPVFWYFGTYLRDGYIFVCVLFLLAISESMLKMNAVVWRKIFFLLVLTFILTGLRFYYIIPFSVIFLIVMYRKLNSHKYIYIPILLSLILYLHLDIVLYLYAVSSNISIDLGDFFKIYLTPLPALIFAESVERYESSLLYNITFPLRLYNLLVAFPMLMYILFNKNMREKNLISLVFVILMTFIIAASGNIGPRQTFIVGLVLSILSLKVIRKE